MNYIQRLCIVLIVFSCVEAGDIQFGNMHIFHRIGMHGSSQFWSITRYENSFSNTDMGTLTPETPLVIDHHTVEIYISESDSVLDYAYSYRYRHCGDSTKAWSELYPVYNGKHLHSSGFFYYASWSVDSAMIFQIPLDTGDYCLEFRHRASIIDAAGDTLTEEYVTPGGQPFRAYFKVREASGWGFADSMRSAVVTEDQLHDRDTLILWDRGYAGEGYFHGTSLGEYDNENLLYLTHISGRTFGDVDTCTYYYRIYESSCTDTPGFTPVPMQSLSADRRSSGELQVSLCGNRGPGNYIFELFGCAARKDSLWTDCLDRPEDDVYRAYFTVTEEGSGTETALPVRLSDLSARAGEDAVILEWRTESETENRHFLLYRDGEEIARIAGHGTCTEPHSYTWTDREVLPGKEYEYRLADVSYGGKVTCHDPVSVRTGDSAEELVLVAASPNPFNPETVIGMRFASAGNARVCIFNVRGEIVEELLNGQVDAGYREVTWNAAESPCGIYIVQVVSGKRACSQKIVLIK